MSSTRDDQPLPDMDDVRNAYRDAGFDDEPPAHVDAFIKAAARRESKRSINDYLPSLAMAATVVLALGLVLRLTVPGRDLVEPSTAPEAVEAPEAAREQVAPPGDTAPPAALMAPAAEDAADQGVQEGAAELEQTTPARASAAAAEESATAASAPAAADMLDEQGAASGAIGRMAAPAMSVEPCTAPERGDPNLWLECIGTRIDAGLLDAARAELAQFRAAFADYPVPANIVQALEP